jgi:hypothetical protein
LEVEVLYSIQADGGEGLAKYKGSGLMDELVARFNQFERF